MRGCLPYTVLHVTTVNVYEIERSIFSQILGTYVEGPSVVLLWMLCVLQVC